MSGTSRIRTPRPMTDGDPRLPAPLRVSWDTSVLIAFLNGEPAGRRCLEVVTAVEAGRVELTFSVIVLAEVLRPRHTPEALAVIDGLFASPGVVLADVTPEIARLASALRAECSAERPSRKLKTPDALILATAVLRCDAFYTLDKKLLRLAGRSFVGDLAVAEPPA